MKMNKVRHLNNNNVEENTILKVQNSYLELKIFSKIKDRVSVFFFFFFECPKSAHGKKCKTYIFCHKRCIVFLMHVKFSKETCLTG